MHQQNFKIAGESLIISLRNEGDQAVANEIFRDRDYKVCEPIIEKATHAIVDIGGHAGFFAVYAGALNPSVPIYSFEPHTGNFKLLKENLKQNRIRNVTPKNQAIWNKIGEMELKLSQEDLNHSLIHAIEDQGDVQKVNTTTLEHLVERQQIRQIDLLKIDCEGAEFEILLDTSKSIFDKVSHIFLEYHDWVKTERLPKQKPHLELVSHLKKMGYQVTDHPNFKMPELGYLWAKK